MHADERPISRRACSNGYEAILQQAVPAARGRAHAARSPTSTSVVMKYLDNLIAWGDSLFQQDTIETINEATQLYVLAANILGPRPQQIPQRGTVRPKTFAQLKAAGLDPMGNALVELEGQFPFNLALPPAQDGGGRRSARAALRHRPHALLLHPAERQAARLLGHRRRPALQDPPLHEHRRASSASWRCSIRRSIRACWSRPRRPASTSAASSTA